MRAPLYLEKEERRWEREKKILLILWTVDLKVNELKKIKKGWLEYQRLFCFCTPKKSSNKKGQPHSTYFNLRAVNIFTYNKYGTSFSVFRILFSVTLILIFKEKNFFEALIYRWIQYRGGIRCMRHYDNNALCRYSNNSTSLTYYSVAIYPQPGRLQVTYDRTRRSAVTKMFFYQKLLCYLHRCMNKWSAMR